jgi:CDGSH-type Zn-finger protein
MDQEQGPRIRVTKDGPYLVRGGVPLLRRSIGCDADGEAVEWLDGDPYPAKDSYALCRCGASGGKPYCDGSHLDVGFDGTEVASRDPFVERAMVIEGPTLTLTDVKDCCAEARFCDARGGLWNRVLDAETTQECAQVVDQTNLCPSGRYAVWDPETGDAIEPDFEPAIVVVEDPQLGVGGPLWVRGGIPVESADGYTYEIRNRVALCRCGASTNKPLCDGTHIASGFVGEP